MGLTDKILRVCDSYDQFFDLSHLEGETIIICPSPVVADSVSERVSDASISTITISQFSRENLRRVLGDQRYQQCFKRKSNLNLSLATVWKSRALQNEVSFSSTLYNQAFNLYTELRSYTLDHQVLNHILELYPEVIQKAVRLFIEVIDQLEILDEHAGYQIITENARSSEQECQTPKEKNLIFWGFPYFSGIQIDMIRSLAIRNRVEVPITRYVYGHSIKTDWVQWFDTEVTPARSQLPPLHCHKIEIGKTRLAASLKNFMQESSLESMDVLLAQKNPTMAQLSEVAIPRLSFKAPIDLLAGRVKQIFADWKQKLETQSGEKILQTDELLQQFKLQLQESIESGTPRYRDFQAQSISYHVVKEWQELSSLNDIVTAFDLEILVESALLNTTRNFQYNMVKEGYGRLVGLEGLDSIDTQKPTLICATQHYGRLNTTGTPFVKGVNEILQDVAPLRRFRFEFEVFKEKLCQLLQKENCYLFIEKDLEKIDRGWAEILSLHAGEQAKIFVTHPISQREEFLFLNEKKVLPVEKVSASKLQSYVECPSKYYFQRNEPLDTFFVDSLVLSPADLGQLEHEVIEHYFKKKPDQLDQLVASCLSRYLAKNGFQIQNIQRESYHQEIKMYAQNGINFLEKLLELDPTIRYQFEKKKLLDRHSTVIETRVDCLVEGDIYRGVLDFKRSSSSIASANKLLNFEKIQLPFYALYHVEEIQKINLLGYICLADISESKFWSPQKEIAQNLYSCCDKRLYRPKDYVIEEWEDFFCQFDKFIQETIEKLKSDTRFIVDPVDDACTYCPVNYLCSRKAVENRESV